MVSVKENRMAHCTIIMALLANIPKVCIRNAARFSISLARLYLMLVNRK
jgi:hypothetical protein